jgi:hypothetical protein
MPIFSSTSHVQINGGNFMEIGRDFNLENIPPSRSGEELLTGLEFCLGAATGRQLEGTTRTVKDGGPRALPYGASALPLAMYASQIIRRYFPPATDYVSFENIGSHINFILLPLFISPPT